MTKLYRSLSQVRVIYIAITLFLVALSVYSFVELKDLIDSSDWVHHTSEVKLSLQKISTATIDAEANQNSFLLIGDSACLTKRDSAFNMLNVQLSLVGNLTKDNPAQAENLKILRAAINEKSVSMKKVMSGYSPLAMSPNFRSNIADGIQKTKDVMEIINKMSDNETELLQQRTQKYYHFAFITPFFIITLFFGALLILLVSYLRINRALQLSGQLEETVIENAVQIEKTKELQNIFAQAPVSISLYRGNNLEVEVINESALQMWGKTYNEVINKSLFEISPELKEVMQPLTANILRTGEPFIGKEFPAQFLHEGKLHSGYFNFSYQPIKDNENTITGIVAIGTEVTEQVIARKKIEESEQRYQQLIYSSPSAIGILYGEDLVITTANEPIIEIWGKGKEIMGKKYFEALPELAEQGYKEVFAKVYKTGVAFNAVETPVYILQNGETTLKYYNFILFPQRNINHEVEGIGIIATEVTSQAILNNKVKESEKQFRDLSLSLEQKVKERTEELRASEEKFFSLFNLSPVCKTLSEVPSGKIVLVNDAFTNVFGYSREETHNKNSVEIGMLNPESRNHLVNELKGKGKIQNEEFEFIKKSGEKLFALTSAEIIRIDGKEFFLGAYNDISDRKKAEINIEKKNIELEKMNKELQSFAYISSHDLQEPLRKIQTFASRILETEENNLSEKGKDSFKRMQSSAHRMQTLIDDLLAYSRTNTGERKFENTGLNNIIEEVKEDLKEELKEKHATIEATELCEANIIAFQFRQLMHNLIGNALKFSSPQQSPHIKIKSEIIEGIKLNNPKLSPQKKYCHISVADNGIGFEQQYSEKIFEVFQRLHLKSEYNGTGIGLAIVKKIVENHEGVIRAKSELNKGATFDIYIPA